MHEHKLYLQLLVSVEEAAELITTEFGSYGIDFAMILAEEINVLLHGRLNDYITGPGTAGLLKTLLPENASFSDEYIIEVIGELDNRILSSISTVTQTAQVDGNEVRFYYPNGLELYVYYPIKDIDALPEKLRACVVPEDALNYLNSRYY